MYIRKSSYLFASALLAHLIFSGVEAKIIGEVTEQQNKRSVSSPVRAGKMAYKHEVTNSQERDEFEFQKTDIGGTYWYGWSYYFTESVLKAKGFTIITQIGAYPSNPANGGYPCGGIGSKISVREGAINLDLQYSGGGNNRKCTKYKLHPVDGLENKWTDFVMHAKWTGNEDGFLKIWMRIGGDAGKWEQKIDYKGRTFWNNEGNGPYMKLGVYLGSSGNGSRLLYMDEYRHGDSSSSFEEVDPGGKGGSVPPPSPEPGNVSISLASGWNLISLPTSPASSSISDVLSGISGKYSAVYAYDGTNYESYVPGSTSNDLTTMVPGRGYWIYMDSQATLNVPRSQATKNVQLKAGWNLAGYPSTVTAPVGQALSSINGKYEVIYAYDSSSNQYKGYVPGGESDLTQIEPGRGYWIYATADTTWSVQ
jgi:predicted RNA-binding protein YlxR (DUF448 family)